VIKAKLLKSAPKFENIQNESAKEFSPKNIKIAMSKLNMRNRVLDEVDIYNLIEHINGSRY